MLAKGPGAALHSSWNWELISDKPLDWWLPRLRRIKDAFPHKVLVASIMAGSEDDKEVWARLDARPPTLVVILKPDHVRDVDLFVRRYGCRAYGPWLFWRTNVPDTELEPIEPGSELPGGLRALYDGRGRNETPLWLPEQRALVFADALTERDGQLVVWGTPWHEKRVLPALRELLELPFEHVIVSHGEPVHDRAEYERALERPPWTGEA